MSDQTTVRDNPAKSRFELEEAGEIAFADYVRRGNVLILPHVEAPMALRGTGAAGRLMTGMLDQVRAAGLRVVPRCPYAAAFIERNKQYQDLLA
jgi:predicted GNAT family acetyltransferase